MENSNNNQKRSFNQAGGISQSGHHSAKKARRTSVVPMPAVPSSSTSTQAVPNNTAELPIAEKDDELIDPFSVETRIHETETTGANVLDIVIRLSTTWNVGIAITNIVVVCLAGFMQNHVPTQLNYFAFCQGNTLSLYSFLKMIGTQSSTINTVEIPCASGTTARFFAQETAAHFLTLTTANTELAKFKKHLSPNEVDVDNNHRSPSESNRRVKRAAAATTTHSLFHYMYNMFSLSTVWWRLQLLLLMLISISPPILSYRLSPIFPSHTGVHKTTTSWLGGHQNIMPRYVEYMERKPLYAVERTSWGASDGPSLHKVPRIIPMDPQLYDACTPVWDAKETKYLTEMKKGELRHLSHNVSVFTFDSAGTKARDVVAPNHLYFRGFYNSLLRTVREGSKRALIGNPGISKSYFQHYYLARLLCPEKFEDALPPDCYHSTEPAQYVIRQFGEEDMVIYDLVNLVAERINGLNCVLLNCFDPENTIYMYEPGISYSEPFIIRHSIPTLVTASPDTRRYKEFLKNGGSRIYMPIYTLDELLTIGKHMRESGNVPEGVSYEEEAIKKRFALYNGIIRSCMPVSMQAEEETLNCYEDAIKSADVTKLLLYDTLEDPKISPFLAQYIVTKDGDNAFETKCLDIVSQITRNKLETMLTATQHVDKVKVLMRNDANPKYMEKTCPIMYEGLITTACTSDGGLGWRRRKAYFQDRNVAVTPSDIVWNNHNIRLSRIECGELPKFKNMQTGVLYYPSDNNFPAVECLYKVSNTELVGFQITRQAVNTKTITVSALKQLLCDKLGLQLHDAGILQLHLIHRPAKSNTAALSLVAKKNKAESLDRETIMKAMPTYYVLEVPNDYNVICYQATKQ